MMIQLNGQPNCQGSPLRLRNQYSSLQWGSNVNELYAANYQNSGFDYYILAVDSNGVRVLSEDIANTFSSFDDCIHFNKDPNYIYSDSGEVLNPSTGEKIGHVLDPRRGQHPLAFRAAQKVHRAFPAREVAALDKRRAADGLINDPRRAPKLFGRADWLANQNLRLEQVGRHQRGERQQVAPQCCDRVARQETTSAGGHHDRIHHQGNAADLPEEARHFADNRGRTQHSHLDRRRGRPGEDGLDLRAHHPGRARVNAEDGPRVLGRDAGDRAGAMHAQRGKGLEIGLDARPASAVGAGDGQCDWLGVDM